MKTVIKINRVLLTLLSIATGAVKLAGMQEEFDILGSIGFSHNAVIVFGMVQVIGGLLLISNKTLKYGAGIMLITFVIATIAVFATGMTVFGVFSILFIVMALQPLLQKQS